MHTLSPALSRRTLLGFGAAGIAALITGCGVRLDRDPELPVFTTADEVRNRVAQILAATTADGDDAQVLAELAQAAGPVWNPPAEMSTTAPATQPPRQFAAGLDEIIREITQNFTELTGPVTGTLVDIAIGALVHRGYPAELHAEADKLRLADPTPPSETATDAADAAGDEVPEHPLVALTRACHQASYGYERLAVHLDAKSEPGQVARVRVEALALLAEELAVFIPELKSQQAPADRAAWALAVEPKDQKSALELALLLEDSLAGPLAEFFRTASSPDAVWYPDAQTFGQARAFAASALYASAAARARLGAPQILRFSPADPAAEPTEEP